MGNSTLALLVALLGVGTLFMDKVIPRISSKSADIVGVVTGVYGLDENLNFSNPVGTNQAHLTISFLMVNYGNANGIVTEVLLNELETIVGAKGTQCVLKKEPEPLTPEEAETLKCFVEIPANHKFFIQIYESTCNMSFVFVGPSGIAKRKKFSNPDHICETEE